MSENEHQFAIENIIHEHSARDIKRFLGLLPEVTDVKVNLKNKTVTVKGGNEDQIERKLMMNSFQVEKITSDQPVQKKTLFKKKQTDKQSAENHKAPKTNNESSGTSKAENSTNEDPDKQPLDQNSQAESAKADSLLKKLFKKR